MRFDVTYRQSSGKTAVEAFEAESRAALFAILSEKGIQAIRVVEAKAGASRKKAHDFAAIKVCAAVVAVVAASATLVFAVFMMLRDKPSQAGGEKPKKQSAIAEHKPSIALPKYEEVLTNKEELIVLPNGVITNKPKTIAEAVAMVRLKPGYHRYKSVDEVFARTNDFQIGEYKQPLFKTQIESHLSMVATRPRDMVIPPMPPLPHNMEKDFDNALTRIIDISEDDTDEDVQTKIRVAELKEKMRSLVKDEGLSVAQAYREIEKEHNRLANMTQLYKGAYRKMVITGEEGAEDFLKAANEALRKEGACEFDEDARTINP